MQPCKECGNCEDYTEEEGIEYISKIFAKNMMWSNHCEKGSDLDNIVFYSPEDIAFGISSINFVCGATSKRINNGTIGLYLKESGNDYTPDGEVYSNNNVPIGINFDNCSQEIPIAEVKILTKDIIEFKWLGFYNKITKIREYLENPFTKKIEREPIILKKCE